ncbi:MAG: hypothetical protein ACM31L_12695 [Actinomycetota bacterium]
MKYVGLILGAVLVLAAPAGAAEVKQERPRLVLGSSDVSGGEQRSPVFAKGAFSAGAVSDGGAQRADRLALGGYVAYDLDQTRLSSSLRGDGGGVSADLAASYPDSVLGLDGTSRLRLGAELNQPHSFSLNPAQSGGQGFAGNGPATDLSVSLSWSHFFTSNLSLGGVAAATRPEGETAGFVLGAGVGYKF